MGPVDSRSKFYLVISLVTLLSHPQIAYELIEVGGAEDILQVQGLSIDGLVAVKTLLYNKLT